MNKPAGKEITARSAMPGQRSNHTLFYGTPQPTGTARQIVECIDAMETHVASEEGNDIDNIVTTIDAAPPHAPRFVLPPLKPGGNWRGVTDVGVVRNHYEGTRNRFHLVASSHVRHVSSDWYAAHEVLATMRRVEVVDGKRKVGDEYFVRSLTLFPTGNGGILGELVCGFAPDAVNVKVDMEAANLEMHEAFLDALQAGDMNRTMKCFTPSGSWVTRDYLSESGFASLDDPAAIRQYVERFQSHFKVLGMVVLNRIITNWYVFAEVLFNLEVIKALPGLVPGTKLQAKTAGGFQVDSSGVFSTYVAYGTPLQAIDKGA